jgi:hypothetical protein
MDPIFIFFFSQLILNKYFYKISLLLPDTTRDEKDVSSQEDTEEITKKEHKYESKDDKVHSSMNYTSKGHGSVQNSLASSKSIEEKKEEKVDAKKVDKENEG